MASLERTVIDIIARQNKLDPATLTGTTTFEELGITSLAMLDLLFALEERFGISIPDDAAQSMTTIGQAVEGLRALGVTRAARAR
jgi:acyl carrier protein